jgi:UDP-2,3-diacylglucosamine pyrophosphatase LpxH
MTRPRESLLLFSDVHLGSDLNDLVERRSHPAARRSDRIDADLVDFLLHYRDENPGADRWRIVVAGDFIDFIGMSVEPEETPLTELIPEEREHGLGNAADHACAKLRRVARRHANVFAALAAFVARGHALTFVHGNHDIELFWDEVRAELKELLFSHAGAGVEREAFFERIDFHPWFFYWEGIAYVEHGHQYDPFCATENLMVPLHPLDPRRVTRGFCDVLLRFVVRPTKGMSEHGHESKGILDYLSFAWNLGLGGMVRLGMRFVSAIIELCRIRSAHLSEAAAALRAEHDRRVRIAARRARIGMHRIQALVALQATPITRTLRGILAAVLIDRLALALVAVLLCAITFFDGWYAATGVVLVTWLALHLVISRRRKVDPDDIMAERATRLAQLVPAAFIVMGHTHAPKQQTMNHGQSTYINLGSWAEEESPKVRAPRTHLVIRVQEGRPIAELRAWGPSGPRRFST